MEFYVRLSDRLLDRIEVLLGFLYPLYLGSSLKGSGSGKSFQGLEFPKNDDTENAKKRRFFTHETALSGHPCTDIFT